MRILIIRHADPDYSIDGLTPTGKKEAKALGEYLTKQGKIDKIYCSPLGRARHTMEAYLEASKTEVEPIIKPWLHEFDALVPHGRTKIAWDLLPMELEEGGDACFNLESWEKAITYYKNSVDLHDKYQAVCQGLEDLLEENGYKKEGHHYKVLKPENDTTIALFCHFGVEAVLLSYLLNASPVIFWQGACAVPSSVTSLYSEERREGIASFRMNAFGDTSHLALAGLEPSFAARFSETFLDPRRHD